MRGRRDRSGRDSLAVAAILGSLLVACSPAASSPAPGSPGSSPGPSAPASSGQGSAPEGIALIELSDTDDPAAAGEHELELNREVRESAGMVALIGDEGEDAFAALDEIEAGYGRQLVADVASALDAGQIPGAATSLAGQVASLGGDAAPAGSAAGAIDVNAFAETGFTASTLMGMFSPIVARAAETGSGTLPGQQPFDSTSGGLRQQGVLNTTIIVATGSGRVSVDIIMAATDNITNATTGAFVALYTSRSTGHFDLDACPDAQGVAKGTYTFETKHELNDVSSTVTARSGGGRSVTAPFRLINGDDAHLREIQATLDLTGDAHGPGTAGGPGPTGPFDWQAAQQVQIVMPANGGTTGTGSGVTVTGTGGEAAGGMMFFSSAMAQLFMKAVGQEAERFWRSGECVELMPSRDTGSVNPNETISLVVTARAKFGDGGEIDKPIKAMFTGKESLDPTGEPQPAPATFTFKAGSQKDDKGTIDLEQTSNRGIGKRQVVYTVGEQDYRIEHRVGGNSYTATKCDGHAGPWTIHLEAEDPMGRAIGTYTFTLPKEGGSAQVRGILDARKDPASVHWDLTGSVTFVPATTDEPARLRFSELVGTATIKAPGITQTVETRQQATTVDLQVGDFCQ
jgi:hypothetical protein